MLIEQGRISALAGLPWAMIEVVPEKVMEEVVLHVAQWAARALDGRAFQLFFPVESRGIEGIRTLSPYLFVRMKDLGELERVDYGLDSIHSAGLVRDNGKIVEAEDEFVQGVMAKARAAAEGWATGIRKGSFVRVLFGEQRMLCGEVEEMKGAMAVVLIRLRSRTVRLTIAAQALLNLSFVPKKEREYYYAG